MRYLIDGYNLLHAMGLLCGKVGPHGLEKARLALLGHLSSCHRAPGHGLETIPHHPITVVFDASGAPPGADPEDDYQGIHIYYALDGEADDLIEDLIRRDSTPGQLVVVSDDHRIQQAARRRRCPVLGCLDYVEEMENLRRPKPPSESSLAKPERVSDGETQHWLREFADLVNDPKLLDALGPDFHDEPS
jgi:predicted RNA-binding protein with PIN domain